VSSSSPPHFCSDSREILPRTWLVRNVQKKDPHEAGL
jgi:hypothetical protein